MINKPSLPKGTRDFLPLQAKRRKHIFKTIEDCFILFGYQPLETPAMENLSTLTGKYGDEGDKLLFKILNSGDYLKDANEELLLKKESTKLIPSISEKGLRYDLTVPFARVVAMYRNDITFPFKRYQIQAVWRADRPQRGRYREFYQCDADVVGSNSLMYEAELIRIYDSVFKSLGIPVKILINHRSILEGIAIQAGCQDQFMAMTIAIDKLDKIGVDGVTKELENIGIIPETSSWILSQLKQSQLDTFKFNDKATLGVQEMNIALDYLKNTRTHNEVVFDATLARGLSYYTGCIFEVVPTTIKMGSLGGCGRYDNLTSIFGLNGVSGVGISFGADRIYDVMQELSLWPTSLEVPVKVLFMALDDQSHRHAFDLAQQCRAAGIPVDVYPDPGKLKKQFKFAEDLKIPFLVILGEDEVKTGRYNLKNQSNGEQTSLTIDAIIARLNS
jgi:histidyl-tRNA synthetase